jgi:mono/diheme cytochrome c family protein
MLGRGIVIGFVAAGLAGAALAQTPVITQSPAPAAQTTPSDKPVSYKDQVQPIFDAHCTMCHAPGGVGYISMSVDLRNYKELMRGSSAGVAIIPYHPDRSPLMRVLVDDWNSPDQNALRMPPLGPQLSRDDLDTISRWIKDGAKNN